MKELRQARDAVIGALNQAGLTALAAFPPGGVREYRGPVAAVAVETAQGTALGFCGYLGRRVDQETGESVEVYGKRLDGVVTVDVRGTRAADCEAGCETAAEALLGRLPDGIRPGELSWEGMRWEKETGMFLRRGRLQCQAVFVAETAEDGGEFLDFMLKGVVRH